MRYSFFILAFAIATIGSIQTTIAAEKPLLFSTAPTHSLKKTKEMYTPITEFLSKKTGRKIILEPSANFIDYSNKIKKDYYDIIFDGPHFVGWRMTKFQHTPIARLPGTIRIVVATKKALKLKSIKDLVGHPVCSFPSPNMLTMSFLEYFPNPVQQPEHIAVKGFRGLENCLLNNPKTYGAVLRDKMWNKMKNKQDLSLLFAPKRGYPERTISTSLRVDPATRKKIASALLSKEAKPHIQKLLKTFKRKALIAANPEDYKDLGKLLKYLWGYELP